MVMVMIAKKRHLNIPPFFFSLVISVSLLLVRGYLTTRLSGFDLDGSLPDWLRSDYLLVAFLVSCIYNAYNQHVE
jgi:hypothetical protein